MAVGVLQDRVQQLGPLHQRRVQTRPLRLVDDDRQRVQVPGVLPVLLVRAVRDAVVGEQPLGLVARARQARLRGGVRGVGQPRPVGAMVDRTRLALQAGGGEQVGHTEECVLRRAPSAEVGTQVGGSEQSRVGRHVLHGDVDPDPVDAAASARPSVSATAAAASAADLVGQRHQRGAVQRDELDGQAVQLVVGASSCT